MQQVKERFSNPDGSKYGSLQSCIRTNDIDLIGDGSHLTYFEMMGNFSFGGDDYFASIDLWDCLLKDLKIPVTHITVHPTQDHHKQYWLNKGYQVKPDEECVWSDGNIGGYCCEVFVGDLEIGNLVNTLGHSTDVGFGFERIIQIIEQKSRVDETSIFDQTLHPIVRDHYRTLLSLKENGVDPGYKSRNCITRRLLHRALDLEDQSKLSEFSEWIESEKQLYEKKLRTAKRVWKKHKKKPYSWWKESFGLTEDEYDLLVKMKAKPG